MTDKIIYRYNDKISFRKCSLCSGMQKTYGDCTNFSELEENWKQYYRCNQSGIHLHCTIHPEMELTRVTGSFLDVSFKCPKCDNESIEIENEHKLLADCLKLLNTQEFKNAKLVRLDDWYVHEVREKKKDESGYWITTDVKTDRDGDTIIIVYVGHKDSNEKAQFFIKPEKGQLTSDHKDMDPSKVLSRIEVKFKDRRLVQEYEEQ